MAIKSFRLTPDLKAKVRQAADSRGISESEFVRDALERAVESELEQRRSIAESVRQLAVSGSGESVVLRTHESFAEIVASRRAR